MTDAKEQLRRLVEGLYIRTSQKKIEWKFVESEGLCESSIGTGFVQVVQEADDDGDYYSYVRVLNGSHSLIDNVYGGSLGAAGLKPVNTPHPNYWELLKDLYSIARRSALGADSVVESIVESLDVSDLDVSDVPF